jgi:hypothetical protein
MRTILVTDVNPLNTKLNPTCHLLALLGAHPILHVSGIRVNAGQEPGPTKEQKKLFISKQVPLLNQES